MNTTNFYFESHVTIEPIFDDQLSLASTIARSHGFKVADLLMKKRKNDTVERSKYDTFMTGRSNTYQFLEDNMKNLIIELRSNGFKVWRYKIENILCDSRYYDIYGLCDIDAKISSTH